MTVDVLIVGAGVAGFSAARELRERSPSTSILLVDKEARLPYKRTKLSKFLAEGFEHDSFALEEGSWYSGQLSLKTGCGVTSIDTHTRQATLSDGIVVQWKNLLLATGARPNLPSLPGVHEWFVLHSQDDTEKLRARWEHEGEVVVLGNGVLGIEIAEQATLAGKRVRLWGRSTLPLTRELTPAASRLLSQTLAAKGVILEQPSKEERTWAVAAIGSEPDLTLARSAGLTVDRGVLVDEAFRTSADGIWSAGDGTQLPGGLVSHLWHQSEAQGKAAARSILGLPTGFGHRPWRLKTEVFGTYWFSMNKPHDRQPDFELVDGSFYQAFWYDDGHLTAAVMANDKNKNKLYEQAVIEGWAEEKVRATLGRG
jgi:NAD(P)H-nitrite reductase large subunit